MARRVGFGDKDRNETRRDAARWERPNVEGREARAARNSSHKTQHGSAPRRSSESAPWGKALIRFIGMGLLAAWAVGNLGGLELARQRLEALLQGQGDLEALFLALIGPAIFMVALFLITGRRGPRRAEVAPRQKTERRTTAREDAGANALRPTPRRESAAEREVEDVRSPQVRSHPANAEAFGSNSARSSDVPSNSRAGPTVIAVIIGLFVASMTNFVFGIIAGLVLYQFLSKAQRGAAEQTNSNGPQFEGFEGAKARRAAERHHREHPEAAEAIESVSTAGRIAGIVFLSLWLIGWTFGIIMVSGLFFADDGPQRWFALVWLAAAVFGWFFAVYALWRLILGKPLPTRNGDKSSNSA